MELGKKKADHNFGLKQKVKQALILYCSTSTIMQSIIFIFSESGIYWKKEMD